MFNLDPVSLQRFAQYNQLNQNVYFNNNDLFVELQNKIQALSNDERTHLLKNSEFVAYNQAYEQGLFGFIADKFRSEYNISPEGQKALNNLNESYNKSISSIREGLEKEQLEIRELKELLLKNPELLNKLKNE